MHLYYLLLLIHTGDGGTYSPNSSHDDLTIEGSGNIGLQLFSPNSSYQYVAFGDPDSVNAGYVRYHHGDNKMVFRTNGGDRVHIDSSGNVGIGNSNPPEVLTVEGNISASGNIYATDYFDDGININTIYVQNSQTGSFLNSGILSSSAQLPSGIISSSQHVFTALTSSGTISASGEIFGSSLDIARDTNASAEIGRAHVGHMGHSDYAGFSHVDKNSTGGYALLASAVGETFINAATSQFIYFRINNSNKASINSSGLFTAMNGVSITGGDLNVTNTISGSVVSASNAVHTPTLNGEGSDTMLVVHGHITASGNISASGYIYAGGDIHAVGDVVASSTTPSDYTLKRNIEDIQNPIEIIKELTGKSFNWKNSGEFDYGLIAQEVEKILPELVKEKDNISGEGTKKVVKYISMIPILIESIKELSSKNDSLEQKLNKLIEDVDKIKNK